MKTNYSYNCDIAIPSFSVAANFANQWIPKTWFSHLPVSLLACVLSTGITLLCTYLSESIVFIILKIQVISICTTNLFCSNQHYCSLRSSFLSFILIKPCSPSIHKRCQFPWFNRLLKKITYVCNFNSLHTLALLYVTNKMQ